MSIKIERTFLLLAIFACSFSFGLSYGTSNQNTYLIHGLTLINPTFLLGDWFAHAVQHYHKNFSFVIVLVNSIGLPIPESLVFIEIILRTLALIAVYKIVYLITKKQAFTSFMLVLTLIVLERTASVAGSYIFSSILQPSSFGATFLLVGIYFFLRGDYFLSGLCIAFSGFMHTNFLLLGFVVFGIAHLFIGVKDIVRRMLAQFSLMLAVFAFQVPFLLDLMSSEHGELATYIFQFIRSPHHYVPNNYLFSFFEFFGWSILGLAGFKLLKIENEFRKKLIGLYGGLLIPIIIATVLTTIVFIPAVSKLFFWRMAPFCVLISQIIFVTAIISKSCIESKHSSTQKVTAFLIIMIGILLIYRWYMHQYGITSKHFIFLTGVFAFLLSVNFKKNIYKLFYININEKIIKLSVIAIAMFALTYYGVGGLRNSTLYNGFPGTFERELYQWTKTTNASSKFLIPPDLQNFRLHGERPIIVDWKSTPVDPDGLIEWYKRIEDIAGNKNVKSFDEAKEGYSNLDLKNLKSLKDKYAISYAIFYADKNTLNYYLPIVFSNDKFVVIELKSL